MDIIEKMNAAAREREPKARRVRFHLDSQNRDGENIRLAQHIEGALSCLGLSREVTVGYSNTPNEATNPDSGVGAFIFASFPKTSMTPEDSVAAKKAEVGETLVNMSDYLIVNIAGPGLIVAEKLKLLGLSLRRVRKNPDGTFHEIPNESATQ